MRLSRTIDAEHLAPILEALPPEVRGSMWAPTDRRWGPTIPPELERAGPDVFMVAGLADAQHFAMNHPLVYLEHGAGQQYEGLEGNGSYSGGNHAGCDVRLYLAPNEETADRWRASGKTARAVGCPRLDRWAGRRRDLVRSSLPRPVVAFTWHWKCELLPETFTAWPAYELALPAIAGQLRAEGITPVGHAHPRFAGVMERWYADHGIPWLETIDEVFAHADVLVGDNTSALPEAAAAGLGVVWLNAPQYRRDVHHGGRFWEWPAGQPQANEPADVLPAIRQALTDPALVAVRAAMVARIYSVPVGEAAQAAATAILEVLT